MVVVRLMKKKFWPWKRDTKKWIIIFVLPGGGSCWRPAAGNGRSWIFCTWWYAWRHRQTENMFYKSYFLFFLFTCRSLADLNPWTVTYSVHLKSRLKLPFLKAGSLSVTCDPDTFGVSGSDRKVSATQWKWNHVEHALFFQCEPMLKCWRENVKFLTPGLCPYTNSKVNNFVNFLNYLLFVSTA